MKYAIPGLLVEYLITGVCALLWVMPLTGVNAESLGINPLYLAPGVYVLGMLVDFVAMVSVTKIKYRIRNKAQIRRGISEIHASGDNSKRKVKIELYAPDLAQEAERRSSRDRIARGTSVNAILIAIFSEAIPIYVSIFTSVTALAMWAYFEYSSYTYVLDAEKEVDQKVGYERNA